MDNRTCSEEIVSYAATYKARWARCILYTYASLAL